MTVPLFGLRSFLFVLPQWLFGKESTCKAGNMALIPESGRPPGGGQPTLVVLPGESHGQRSWLGYSP